MPALGKVASTCDAAVMHGAGIASVMRTPSVGAQLGPGERATPNAGAASVEDSSGGVHGIRLDPGEGRLGMDAADAVPAADAAAAAATDAAGEVQDPDEPPPAAAASTDAERELLEPESTERLRRGVELTGSTSSTAAAGASCGVLRAAAAAASATTEVEAQEAGRAAGRRLAAEGICASRARVHSWCELE